MLYVSPVVHQVAHFNKVQRTDGALERLLLAE
jgi:hypothetical protein